MPLSSLTGILVVLLGGMVTGSFAVPMKRARLWPWENLWAAYSLVGLIVIPWGLAFATVPSLMEVYRSTPGGALVVSALLGFGWGVANVLFGVGVPLAGMALSFAIVVGMSASLGSLIPLLFSSPERIRTAGGQIVIAGVAVTLVGVGLMAMSGRGRERSELKQGSTAAGSVSKGIVLLVLAGFLAPMLNFSFAFGSEIQEQAVLHGASRVNASNAVWVIGLLGGFLSNFGYAAIKLQRHRTWNAFTMKGASSQWTYGALMAVFWTGGTLMYGWGASILGALGAAIGWPIFQATIIITSAALGFAAGEWSNTERKYVRMNYAALAVLITAIVILSIGNRR